MRAIKAGNLALINQYGPFSIPSAHTRPACALSFAQVIGTPTSEEIERVPSQEARTYLRSMPYMPAASLATTFPTASPLAIDLLEGMLRFDPAARLTVEAALRHPYLAALHDPADEPDCPRPFDLNGAPSQPTLDQVGRFGRRKVGWLHVTCFWTSKWYGDPCNAGGAALSYAARFSSNQIHLPASPFPTPTPLSRLAQIRYALFQEMVGYNPDLQLL